MTFNPLLCFILLLNVLNSPLLPPLYTKSTHLLELEAPRTSHKSILHRGGKNFAYKHNLAWTHSSLLTLAHHCRAMGPPQRVPGHLRDKAQSLKGTWGAEQLWQGCRQCCMAVKPQNLAKSLSKTDPDPFPSPPV